MISSANTKHYQYKDVFSSFFPYKTPDLPHWPNFGSLVVDVKFCSLAVPVRSFVMLYLCKSALQLLMW